MSERERVMNHPDKLGMIDDADYGTYLGLQAEAWCENPPPAPAGFELIECAHVPRHWPTYTVADDDFYEASCPHCWVSNDQERISELEHRLHKPWMRWKLTFKVLGWLYVLGLTSGYGMRNCYACPSWVLSGPIHWGGSRPYVLGLKRETWRCLRAGHRPGDPIGFGYCSKCLPCPDCGSKTAGHASDCPELSGRVSA